MNQAPVDPPDAGSERGLRPRGGSTGGGSGGEPGSDSGLLPFDDFTAPLPLSTEPPTSARWLAFVGVVVGGLLGGMIGFGTSDLLGLPRWGAALVAIAFAVLCAAGVGIVAQLTLRAMNEWNAVNHPEDRRGRT